MPIDYGQLQTVETMSEAQKQIEIDEIYRQLSATNHLWIRQQETGKAMPVEVANTRAALYAHLDEILTA